MQVEKARVERWLAHQERKQRQQLDVTQPPFDRGYTLGLAHAYGYARAYLQRLRKQAVARGRAPLVAGTPDADRGAGDPQ